MKFDVIVGNPPYGKNANLAVKFLNMASTLTKNIFFVLPKSFRKPSIINRIHSQLHLIQDHDVDNSVFPDQITACWQQWQVETETREKITTVTTHPDFEFVNKELGEVALGRVGGGPCGRIYTEFTERSPNTHYFLKVKNPQIIDRLRGLETEFRTQGHQTVGLPSLSKNDLINIYSKRFDK